ncbi:MAG: cysteine-rich CWC family protein [Luteolibacter sp.]|uniref:cysteine-rich CWC family protein n=1 Tax=Luteolibacter sp. TaxID=1962973 RepID=UPI003265C4BC
MSRASRETPCPFCGEPNHCGVSDPGGCWCGKTEIPMELIDLLPEQGKTCICEICVEAYKQNPREFIRLNRTNPP